MTCVSELISRWIFLVFIIRILQMWFFTMDVRQRVVLANTRQIWLHILIGLFLLNLPGSWPAKVIWVSPQNVQPSTLCVRYINRSNTNKSGLILKFRKIYFILLPSDYWHANKIRAYVYLVNRRRLKTAPIANHF